MREGIRSKAWNGEWYANFSTDRNSRDWRDAVRYSFLSAGGGSQYGRQLRRLSAGDRVWVKVKNKFVGVGLVNGDALPARSFKVKASGSDGPEIPVLQARLFGTYYRQSVNDLDVCEYFVPMLWLETVPVERGIPGLFGNPNTVCKPTNAKWLLTVQRLKQEFPNYDNR